MRPSQIMRHLSMIFAIFESAFTFLALLVSSVLFCGREFAVCVKSNLLHNAVMMKPQIFSLHCGME